MRIWSIHPKYLDSKGLVALWRETLLAKNVLEEKTKGYKNHPQLDRFKNSNNALGSINLYLVSVYEESIIRGYKFDKQKIDWEFGSKSMPMTVTKGQLAYEMQHLKNKLKTRDPERFYNLTDVISIDAHPLFKIIEGGIEEWEIIQSQQ